MIQELDVLLNPRLELIHISFPFLQFPPPPVISSPVLYYDRVSTKNRKVLHFVASKDFHTDLPLR